MNKTMKMLVGAFVLLSIGSLAMAASGVRGAKGKTVINSSATASLACSGHCTVYSVWIASTTTADMAVLRDTNTANVTSIPTVSVVSTTTATTWLALDPPLIFTNGVSLNCGAGTWFCGVSFDPGDATTGY